MSIPLLCWRIEKAELVLLIKKTTPQKEKKKEPSHKRFQLLREGWYSQAHIQPLQCLAGLTSPFPICLVSSKHNARSDSCTAACTGRHRPAHPH